MIPGKVYTPEEVLHLLVRRKWLLVVPFVAVTGATLATLRLLPDRYRSETLILVVPQRVPESYVKSTVSARIEDRLPSISQQILSRMRLEKIVLDFNLYADARRSGIMEDVIERMRRDIDVRMVKGDAFRVSYVSERPETAKQVTERLASLFIDENLRDREVLAEATNQFLGTQLDEARRQLEAQEHRLEEYRKRYAGQLPSQLESNLQVVQNAQLQIQALEDSLNRDRDHRLSIERAIADANAAQPPELPAPVAEPQAAVDESSPAVRLERAKAALDTLRLRLRPEHPDVVRLARTVETLEAQVGALPPPPPKKAPTPAPERPGVRRLAQLASELAALDTQMAAKVTEQETLRTTIAQHQASIAAAPARESELMTVMRDYDTMRKVYADLLSKREESKVAANLERRQIGEQFKVLDPAGVPERPFKPNRPMLAGVGALGGLGLGLALIALVELRDTSLRSVADVRVALSLPVLAMIPAAPDADGPRGIGRVGVVAAVVVAIVTTAAFALWTLSQVHI